MYLTPLMLIEKLNFAITQEEIKRKQVVAILLIPLNKIVLIVISLLIQGSFFEEVRQLTFSVQSFELTNQILSDDTSDICIMLQCRRSTVRKTLFQDLNG